MTPAEAESAGLHTDPDLPMPPQFERIGLAVVLTTLAAGFGVFVLGTLSWQRFRSMLTRGELHGFEAPLHDLLSGAETAFMASTLSVLVFYVTLPICAIVISLTIGRLPRRRIIAPLRYFLSGSLWGSVLVGGTTGAITLWNSPYAFHGPLFIVGAFFGGVLIGFAVGGACGLLFHAIVRPAKQIAAFDSKEMAGGT